MDEPVGIEPLRERFPIYLKLFGMGAGAVFVVGALVMAVSDLGWRSSFGYTSIAFGTLLLLVGGSQGGGYANIGIGALEAVVGGRNRTGDDYVEDPELRRGNVFKRRDPMERLRKGLRPEANPTAFWQSVAGFAYLGLGVLILF